MRLNKSHLKRALGNSSKLLSSQFKVLGYDGPFKGYKTELIGREFADELVYEFIRLRDPPTPGPSKKQVRSKKLKRAKRQFKKSSTPKKKQDDKYLTPEWIEVRNKIYRRDEYKCVNCGKGKSDGVRLAVHHLVYNRDVEVWDVPDWYLVTLCKPCHTTEHSKRLAPPPKLF